MIASTRSHRITSISVVGGFLDGLALEFSGGLNCLIGHRGTGKTTVLEFVRFALDAFPEGDVAARKRVEALVRSNLGDGRIRLTLVTKDGLEYIVDRTASGDAMVLTADGQPTDITLRTGGLFRADVFSQNEVENIADSPPSQLALIDRFAADEISQINRQIAGLRADLDANAGAVLPARRQLDALAEELSTLPAVEAKIAGLAGGAGDRDADDIDRAHQHRALRGRELQAVEDSAALADQYGQWVSGAVGQFTRKAASLYGEEILAGPNGALVTALHAEMKGLGDTLDGLFRQAESAVEAHRGKMADLTGKLQQAHQQQELSFRDLIARHRQAQGLATERAEWERRRNALLAKRRQHAEVQSQLDELLQQRGDMVAQLRDLWDRRFAVRRQVAEWINEQVSSPIRVRIDQCGDPSAYQAYLATSLKGSVAQHNVVARKISQYLPPSNLARMVAEGKVDDLQTHAELTDSQAAGAVEALGRLDVQLTLGAIEQADLPRIELLDGQEWKDSLRLSTGQKCTTILPILLLDSDGPLLVDQPEDNLDNRFVFDTVVEALHRVKRRRQIVLITHNPNIPVLGEASRVCVLTSDGERSTLARAGDVDDCKTEIINLLEGGREAFVRRKERYDY